MFNSALICAIVPWKVTELVPLPLSMIAPLVPAASVRVPSVTESITVSTPLLPSTSETDIPLFLRSSAAFGATSYGFVAINAAHSHSAALIDWWSRKLEFDCFVDLEASLFTDQKWMDLAPGLFPDVRILRHDGYNVAYWNLVSRPVARAADGGYTANGVPLVFAHFSGVDLSKPGVFSKHQNRFNAGDIGGLHPLYETYLDGLRANDHAEHGSTPYAYGTFPDGEKIALALRRAYHRYFDVCCEQPEPHPLAMDRARFNEPCPELPNVSRAPVSCLMYAVWQMREDLREAFNLSSLDGRQNYIHFFLSTVASDMGLGKAYVEPIRSRFVPASDEDTTGAPKGYRKRLGAQMLRVFVWGKQRSGLMRLYTRIPFAWRLEVRRRLHAAAGVPMPPLPFESARKRARSIRRAPPPVTPGVNLLGYARGEFGVAENVRSYARALEQVTHPFLIFNFDVGTASRQQDNSMERHFSDTLRYADNMFFINADQMQIARDVLGRDAFAGRHNIGFWVWELEKFPHDWRDALDLVDEVWVPTGFVRDAIAAATDKPVLRMPKAIEFEVPQGMGRAHFGLPPDEFVFLFSYDFNGFVARKNPEAVISAFRQAFPGGTNGVRLLVKSTNGGRFPERLEALRRGVSDDPRIEVRDEFLTREEMSGLQDSIDCFVSLHRSEGFGLGMAECMYLGKPVIATGYSGNLDFMDRDNSLLVDYRRVPLCDGDYPYWQGQQWADPEVAHAARLMRQVFDDREFARRLGSAAAASIRRTNSRAVCGAATATRLHAIDRRRTVT